MEQALLDRFLDWERRLGAMRYAMRISEIGEVFGSPRAGAKKRREAAAVLAGEIFSLQTDPSMEDVLAELSLQPLTDELRRRVELHTKERSRLAGVPKDLFLAWRTALAESRAAWHEAKADADWEHYAPYLERLAARHLELYRYRTDRNVYDCMLAEHQTGWDRARYDAFFDALRARLVPLLRRVQDAEGIDDSFLHQPFDVEKQRAYMCTVTDYLGFTPDWGVIGESEHPLTSVIFAGDVRFTTKYRPNCVTDAVLSTVHESGHAWYFHNVDPELDGTILANSMEAGMQESQSRLFENHFGRSRAFWEANLPALQRMFPEQLGSVSLDVFVRALNASKPSAIRTEADMLTYPLHILIRYELEKALFSGAIQVQDLRDGWNELYRTVLGVAIKNDAEGILQDMHWPYAYFGYFPTYALGSAFAAQFDRAMRRQVDVDGCLAQGRFPELTDWLRRNIHRFGNLIPADEVLLRATGEPFCVSYYLEYLETLYTELYHLD